MRWEYLIETAIPEMSVNFQYILNDRGSRGWELAALDGRVLVMKRPIEEEQGGKPDPDPTTGAGQDAGDEPVLPMRGQGQ